MRRKGKIIVSETMIDNDTDAFELGKMFSTIKFTPTIVDRDMKKGLVEFIGFSPNFREVPRGEETPQYLVTIYRSAGEISDFSLQEVHA